MDNHKNYIPTLFETKVAYHQVALKKNIILKITYSLLCNVLREPKTSYINIGIGKRR